ncbi:MAG: 30S ribosomal protein S18 [Bdellovibrio sp. CG12_big_fil_rev_8_21_14_0_65_39_13]|nr:MAG: 30S ribosomal protein S18 [Bdellovibrio sp. CG22_combo_CG10-13_8_21_14_all_39_27]PIQ59683.1 MAG: 30S ribosomal protein S18 [Bdellovibrio sp. CG12_big_fil_rev_8_21_14_0_65_39_13]PIR36286.1 MAG: 30S ribosomal protein S18 [Bdellovibrio sp. CG11_big_fil_rev_8_21_14_0_20_39_38]
MLYEAAIVARPDAGDEAIKSIKTMVEEVVKAHKGEIVVNDDWGTLLFAQPTSTGLERGHYLYFMYKADGDNNRELIRRLGINESVMKNMIIKVTDQEKFIADAVKNYKTPFSKTKKGSIMDSNNAEEGEEDTDKRKFTRRKSCWYTANKVKADWKDPGSYFWLINEFGKISPARISAVSRKHQRFATTAIKRARQMGLVSHVSDRIAQG